MKIKNKKKNMRFDFYYERKFRNDGFGYIAVKSYPEPFHVEPKLNFYIYGK